MKAKFINEVLRDENDWADREIDRFQGKDVKEPVKKDFDWKEYIPDDEVDPDNISYETDKNQLEDAALQEKNMLIKDLNYLEQYIWENGNPQQLGQWSDFVRRYGEPGNIIYEEIKDMEILEELFYTANMLVNQMNHKSE